jgi:hypothetical protein
MQPKKQIAWQPKKRSFTDYQPFPTNQPSHRASSRPSDQDASAMLRSIDIHTFSIGELQP